MYVQRNRGKVILRVEMLEDRRLLSGGLIRSLLASPLPSLFLRLTPSDVAAALQEGKVSVGVAAGANGNSGGVTVGVLANANAGASAGATLAGNINLLAPGGTLLAFGASGLGTSGMGALISFGAGGSINPTQGVNGGGSGQVGVGALLDFFKDFGINLGGNDGTGFGGGERMNLPGAGALNGPGPGDLGIPDLFTADQTYPGAEPAQAGSSAPGGLESAAETAAAPLDSGLSGSDGKALSPQADDLQDASSSFGPLGRMLQRLLDEIEDFGSGLSNWLGHLSWVSGTIGIALAAAAYAGVRQAWRRRQGHEALHTTTANETVEPWWFPGLR